MRVAVTDQEPSEGSTTAADVLYLMLQVDAAECEQRRDAESAESRCHDAPGMKSQYCFSVPRDKLVSLFLMRLKYISAVAVTGLLFLFPCSFHVDFLHASTVALRVWGKVIFFGCVRRYARFLYIRDCRLIVF